jgi:hypothetical protein
MIAKTSKAQILRITWDKETDTMTVYCKYIFKQCLVAKPGNGSGSFKDSKNVC